MKRVTSVACAAAALLGVSSLSTSVAFADGKDYNDGAVINVASIRTAEGHFDE